jgi:hypothetical protein
MNDQFAFISKNCVPTADDWQAAINQSGFDMQLSESFEVFEHTGYLPCTLLGEPAGFELRYDHARDIFDDEEQLALMAGDRDYCITMSWGGSMRDCVAVMIASLALAQHFDANISYGGDEPDSVDELQEETQDLYDEVKSDEAE